MTVERVPRRAADFRLELLDDEVLLYHPGLTRAIRLNDSAALVWNLCDGRRSARDIANALCDAFPEQAATIPGDVAHVLARLESEGAIEPQ